MRPSFRFRFVLWFSGLSALLVGGFIAAKVLSFDRELQRDLRRDMRDECDLLAGLLEEEIEENGSPEGARVDLAKIVRDADHPLQFLRGSELFASAPRPVSPPTDAASIDAALSPDGTAWTSPGGDDFLVVARSVSIARGGFAGTIVSARSTEPIRLRLQRSIEEGVLFWAVAVALSVLVGRFLSDRALAPVRALTRVAEGLRAEDLSVRAGPGAGDPELTRLVEAFNRMLDRLSAAFGRLDRYTADVAHEVQTPLAVMKGHLEVALRETAAAPEHRELLGTLLSEVESMQGICRDLLYLARADQEAGAAGRQAGPGGVEPARAEVDLDEVAHVAQEIGALLGTARGIRVELAHENGALRVRGDRSQLLRATTNLVDNAVKYGRDGGRVAIRVGPGPRGVRLEVEDDGIGIAGEDLPHVFERFYKADRSRDREARGTGLGLSVAQAIVHAHGGALLIRSELGRGTTATIDLPRERHA